ncbi:MAG: SRPBCC family protein [Actinomycetota bacterium]
MRLQQSIVVERAPEQVFSLLDDQARYPEFFVGITCWEPRSTKRRQVGARYRVLMRVGSIEAGGTVRIARRKANRVIAWESERGVVHRGSWRLEPCEDGTRLNLEIDYRLSGGPVGWLVERIAGRMIGRNMWATLMAARRLIETETKPG